MRNVGGRFEPINCQWFKAVAVGVDSQIVMLLVYICESLVQRYGLAWIMCLCCLYTYTQTLCM